MEENDILQLSYMIRDNGWDSLSKNQKDIYSSWFNSQNTAEVGDYDYLNYTEDSRVTSQIENRKASDNMMQQRIANEARRWIDENKSVDFNPLLKASIASVSPNSTNSTCIYGVCGVLKAVGALKPGDPQYHQNTAFQAAHANHNFALVDPKIENITPGTIIQHKDGYWGEPTHAQIFSHIDEYGNYVVFDNYMGTNTGVSEKVYSPSKVENWFLGYEDKDKDVQLYHYGSDSTEYATARERRLPQETLLDRKYDGEMYKTAVVNKPGEQEFVYSPQQIFRRYANKKEIELMNHFNDPELDEALKSTFLITQDTLDELKPIIYGIAMQESDMGKPNNYARGGKQFIEHFWGEGKSKGMFAVKYSNLRPIAKELIKEITDDRNRIKESNTLYNTKSGYIGALDILLQSGSVTDNHLQKHEGLQDKHPYAPALYFYNGQGRKIVKGDERLTDEDRLRADEGSYPNKVMGNAETLRRYPLPNID